MVPIDNNGDPQRPKGILKAIGICSCPQSTTSESLTEHIAAKGVENEGYRKEE